MATLRDRRGLLMRVLIVQSNESLGCLWQRHLERLGASVDQVATGAAALNRLQSSGFDVIVLDLMIEDGIALTVADLCDFWQPEANVVFVTDTTFFSDGSIFRHAANARALIQSATAPRDLAAIVHHYGHPNRAHAAHRKSAAG